MEEKEEESERHTPNMQKGGRRDQISPVSASALVYPLILSLLKSSFSFHPRGNSRIFLPSRLFFYVSIFFPLGDRRFSLQRNASNSSSSSSRSATVARKARNAWQVQKHFFTSHLSSPTIFVPLHLITLLPTYDQVEEMQLFYLRRSRQVIAYTTSCGC